MWTVASPRVGCIPTVGVDTLEPGKLLAFFPSFDATVRTEVLEKFAAVVSYGMASGGGSEAVSGVYYRAVSFGIWTGPFEAISGSSLGVGGI